MQAPEASQSSPCEPERSALAAVPVLAAGIVAAIHVGKLPPALIAIQQSLRMDLVSASFLVALFQLGGALSGVFGGALADRFGPRRAQICGLILLGCASLAGAGAQSAFAALCWRSIESLGFIMSVLPGPSLIARVVAPRELRRWLGLWGGYMPTGFALALMLTPWILSAWGWRASWIATGLAALCCALAVRRWVPPDPGRDTHTAPALLPLIRATVSRPGPWLLSLIFVFYAGQFISIFAFLPSIYQQAGLSAASSGWLSAIAVASNVLGNVAAGRLLQREVPAAAVIAASAVTMALCEWVAFGSAWGFGARYMAVLVLSTVAGLIPGVLFASVPRHAPAPGAVATTVGLVQQGAGVGQLVLPPVVAWVAAGTGGWTHTWLVTGLFAAIDLVLALLLARHERALRRAAAG